MDERDIRIDIVRTGKAYSMRLTHLPTGATVKDVSTAERPRPETIMKRELLRRLESAVSEISTRI